MFLGCPRTRRRLILTMSPLLLVFILISSEAAGAIETLEQCLAKELMRAGDELTVGELKKICRGKLAAAPGTEKAEAISEEQRACPLKAGEEESPSLMAERRRCEAKTEENAFAITPHRPNYVLFASYNATPNTEPFMAEFPNAEEDIDHTEIKFQISLKFPIYKDTFIWSSDLYAAYTNRSFWQAYNDLSAPFRDINHEPEVWLAFNADWDFFGFENRRNDFGFNHQSNGRGGALSRSWNRIYANLLFEKENLFFNIKPWWRIPEDEKSDDNPDIHNYLGYGELTGGGQWKENTVSFLLRNNLRFTDNRGAFQVDWSFPFFTSRYLRWYFQYFTGYGESLIDYNASSDSFGFGVQLTDWF